MKLKQAIIGIMLIALITASGNSSYWIRAGSGEQRTEEIHVGLGTNYIQSLSGSISESIETANQNAKTMENAFNQGIAFQFTTTTSNGYQGIISIITRIIPEQGLEYTVKPNTAHNGRAQGYIVTGREKQNQQTNYSNNYYNSWHTGYNYNPLKPVYQTNSNNLYNNTNYTIQTNQNWTNTWNIYTQNYNWNNSTSIANWISWWR